jgi:hypothetical protein
MPLGILHGIRKFSVKIFVDKKITPSTNIFRNHIFYVIMCKMCTVREAADIT